MYGQRENSVIYISEMPASWAVALSGFKIVHRMANHILKSVKLS
jgi:hypothetical protein